MPSRPLVEWTGNIIPECAIVNFLVSDNGRMVENCAYAEEESPELGGVSGGRESPSNVNSETQLWQKGAIRLDLQGFGMACGPRS